MKVSVRRVIVTTLILNIILTTIKLAAGMIGHSSSLFSDGINSLADVAVSVMILVVLKISNKKPDHNHPYGHQKYEGLLYLFLGLIILMTALVIGYQGTTLLINYFATSTTPQQPTLLPLIIAIIAILIKIVMFVINYRTANKYQLPSIKADSLNHLFDIFATAASLIGIIFAQSGYIYIEYIATIVIALIILKSSITMISEAIAYLVDQAPDSSTIKEILNEILTVTGVIAVDDLKVRMHMNHFYVDVEIAVDHTLTLEAAHEIAEVVHHRIEQKFNVLHCMVHVNPYKKKKEK